ncbi:SGNH/GDSL hydrolase family protein [Nocardioides campestrisoli]|uniref:SGNH/GDSL hydrolase family protein n=1 Tax=Nocardioides campestrisoli TaxID=2736757 RepID=UPI0015E74DB7|nr:SGNH/GDSL hydrolase family protein [Nocardioides campestrisoli]
MAETFRVTGSLIDAMGLPAGAILDKAVIHANIAPGDAVVDLTANSIQLFPRTFTVGAAGFVDLTFVDTDATDLNVEPGTLQYKLEVTYSAITQYPRTWSSGWFSVTEDRPLADVAAEAMVSPMVVRWRDAFATELEGLRDDAVTAAQTFTASAAALGPFWAQVAKRTTKPAVVVFLGDSFTYGLSASPRLTNRWPARVLAHLQANYPSGTPVEQQLTDVGTGFPTVNTAPGVQGYISAVGGATTQNYVNDLSAPFTAWHRPGLIVHMIGVNDARVDGRSAAAYKAGVLAAIDRLDDEASTFGDTPAHLLVHTYRPAGATLAQWKAYGAALAEVAAGHPRAAFLDLSEAFEQAGAAGADPLDLVDVDGLHPSNTGHAMIADLVVRGLNVAPGPVALTQVARQALEQTQALKDEVDDAAALVRDISNIDTSDDAFDAAMQLPDGKARARLTATFAPEAQVASGIVPRRLELPYTQGAETPTHRAIRVLHRPASVTNYVTLDTAGNANVDAALTASITCPPSGRIRYRLEAGVIVNATTALRWVIRRNGSSITSTETIVKNNLSTAATGIERVSAEGEITVDETGAALVPGRSYTFTWGHGVTVAGKTSWTVAGGNAGAAVFTLEPVVPNYRDCGYTQGSSGFGAAWPLWLCHDRKTILGASASPWRVRWSTDGGTTWGTPAVAPGFPQSIQQIRELDDGEILVFVGATASVPASAWRSTGWVADKSTATFAKVLEMQGPDVAVSGSMGWREFSISTHGPIVLATEYGASKAGPTNTGRYTFISEDYGRTWRILFDLMTLFPGESGVHMHAAEYDPWWDCIWITTGDDPTSVKGEKARNLVAFDWRSGSPTWERIPGFVHQCTTVIATPTCILFVTDKGDPNAIYRVPRTTRNSLRAELAYVISANAEIVNYGTSAFQLRTDPSAPVLFGLQSDVTAHPARVVATYDGYEFREVWRDTTSYSHRGVLNVVGPLEDGKIVAHVSRGDGTLNQRERLTFTPQV